MQTNLNKITELKEIEDQDRKNDKNNAEQIQKI